jgi:hypothetical protein
MQNAEGRMQNSEVMTQNVSSRAVPAAGPPPLVSKGQRFSTAENRYTSGFSR